ncbi:MAG: ABC transporter permease [Solobacterium sp.]|nr:ABC transporter permease [Solobacterium sp.]
MNAFNRAWRYITRKPTKSILLIITFFLIGNLVILGLGISQAADNAKVLTRKQMRAVVSYEIDYDAYWKYINTLTDQDEIDAAYSKSIRIDKDVALKLTEDERVKAFNYMVNSIAYSDGFENVPLGNESNRQNSTYINENGEEVTYKEPNLMIYANMYDNMIELEEGTFEVVEGRFYTQSDIDNANKVVVITKELADQNALRVGDTIRVSTAGDYLINQLKTEGLDTNIAYMDLEICGIYTTLEDVDPNAENFQWMSPYESPKNIILMPMTSYIEYIEQITRVQYDIMMKENPGAETSLDDWLQNLEQPSKVVYLLSDPLEVDSFVEDHQNDVSEFTRLNANNETFKKLARPLDTMSFFANIVVWIVIINAIVIISLVTALTLKTREYEIGVLLSIGVSKIKVILQLFVELILIALLGFTLAVVSGSLMASKVGDMVLDYQTTSDAQYGESEENYYYTFGADYFTQVTQDDLLREYHVSVSPLLIGEIYILGTGVVLIAILIPSIMIMRLNPKQILLEQN